MARLKLYHQGELLKDLELNPGEEYFAGRSSQCQFVLEHDRGISRQHIKIAFEDNVWTVTLLSRFGGLAHAGKPADIIRLEGDTRFSLPPYEFEFIAADAMADMAPVSDEPLPVEEKPQDPEALVPEVNDAGPAAAVPDEPDFSEKTSAGNFEATQMAASSIVPFLRILNRANGHEEILKLEGNVWTAGRHPNCEIFINDSSISRKHFELARTAEGFFVTDQNSSNGTTINDEKIAPGEPYKLNSGDVITVRNIQITFEVHDLAFEQKIKNLPAVVDQVADNHASDDDYEVSNVLAPMDAYDQSQAPAVIKLPPAAGGGWQKHKMKIAIGALLAVVLAGGLMDEGSAPPPSDREGATELHSEKSLSPQKMAEIKDKFELAKRHYERGNYALCKDLLLEIHVDLPSFEDSPNLLKFCEQGIELQQINRERELKEQKAQEAQNKIRSVVANCNSQYTEKTTYEEMQNCLNEALELDPQHAAALELLDRIKIRDEQRKTKELQQREIAALADAGRNHYKRAVALESRGQWRLAIKEYSSFLEKNYPGLSKQEENARRSLAAIRQNLAQKVSERVSSCRLYIEKSEYKAAINACDEALREDPGNADAKELKEKAQVAMRSGLKSIWEDAVLEENMGNIEAAKEKWRTIMGNSFKGETFYERARARLRKYGG